MSRHRYFVPITVGLALLPWAVVAATLGVWTAAGALTLAAIASIAAGFAVRIADAWARVPPALEVEP